MPHAESSNLISLGLATDISPESSSFRWGLVTSCLLHALIIILAVFLRFQSTPEEPFRTIDVALISLPEGTSEPKQEKRSLPDPAPSKPQPAPPKAQPAPPNTDSTPRPREEILPPLPTQTASERLSDFLGGAIRSIVVPDRPEAAPPVMPSQLPEPPFPKGESPVLPNLHLPSSAPQLSRPERLHPAQPLAIPKEDALPHKEMARTHSAPPQPEDPEPPSPTQQSPLIHKAAKQAPAIPELSPVTPFHKSKPEQSHEVSSAANMEEALKQNLPTVPTPLPAPTIQRKATSTQIKPKKFSVPEMSAPQLAKVQAPRKTEPISQSGEPPLRPVKPATQRVKPVPQHVETSRQYLNKPVQPVEPIPPHVKQEPPREKMSNMMKQLLGEVQIPDLKPQPSIPLSHQEATSPPSATPVQAEIDQRIAKLSVPDVTPVASIKNRLQRLEVESTSNTGKSSSSQPSSTNYRYQEIVQGILQDQWENKTPLVADAPMVILQFRIARTGEISQIRIAESSGNAFYDSAAQRAVHAVNPLPPFPPEISDSYLNVRWKAIKE